MSGDIIAAPMSYLMMGVGDLATYEIKNKEPRMPFLSIASVPQTRRECFYIIPF